MKCGRQCGMEGKCVDSIVRNRMNGSDPSSHLGKLNVSKAQGKIEIQTLQY